MTDQIVRLMTQRENQLKKAVQKALRDAGDFPQGRLRSSSRNGKDRYYHVLDANDPDGKYIRRGDRILAQKLAQKEYNEEFIRRARGEIDAIHRMISKLADDGVEPFYENMIPSRKNLITPYILDDELYSAEWQAKPFPPCTYKPEKKIFETKRGEMVRSKSEMILADMFYELGIPYRYEQPLRMKDGSTRYPDFTLLKISTRKEFYLEHLGMMGDIEYVTGNLEKLDIYRANGIYPGKNLLITYETEESPLDVAGVRKMIRELFVG